MALLPHLRPELLDPLHITDKATGRRFTRFGGQLDSKNGFIPTVETIAFFLGGDDLSDRMRLITVFEEDTALIKQGLIELGDAADGTLFSCPILPGRILMELLGLEGRTYHRPVKDVPAQVLNSRLGWDDLIVDQITANGLERVVRWAELAPLIDTDRGPGRLIGQGYRALFHGPPGTGKTLSAALLGQRTGLSVYRVDLSQVTSKWIGETEKNLARLFEAAERERRILFFDEADALFSQRTETRSSNDRSANQEVAYILQRIEAFEGIVLLATNLRTNLDEAFSRRFQEVVQFSEPGPEERLKLWQRAFHNSDWLADGTDLTELADTFELTGATIVNCLRDAMLTALATERRVLTLNDLMAAAQREVLQGDRVLERRP
ncbi:Proteasome-activating nucleotidase 2 [Nymphon striatum]|nr:Proteasome-activating nucleotidase 2 [Nymphon striatum]